MTKDWLELTRITGNSPLIIEKVRLMDKDIKIEGEFELPPLARLSAEDQIFIIAFVRCDGSIKEMEKTFGISYPTVKNRLTRIAQQFAFVETVSPSPQDEILAKLEKGEISANEAIARLSK
jgi:hypothetical protein